MTVTPKISIQMCTYNRAHFIEKSIQSVLSQTFQDWELIITDDKSTDNTRDVVEKYLSDPRIKYIVNEENLGITKNRNKSISLSQGEYIAVLDSDDYWVDNQKLKKQIDFLDTNKDYALVGTHFLIVDENDNKIKNKKYLLRDRDIKNRLIIKNEFCHSSTMYRKNIVVNEGLYDESLPIWEDYDLFLKIGIKNKLANLNIFSTAYRRHSNQSDKFKIKQAQYSQRIIIKRYHKYYRGYILAIIIDILRNIRTNIKLCLKSSK